jgi:hypothetical protein
MIDNYAGHLIRINFLVHRNKFTYPKEGTGFVQPNKNDDGVIFCLNNSDIMLDIHNDNILNLELVKEAVRFTHVFINGRLRPCRCQPVDWKYIEPVGHMYHVWDDDGVVYVYVGTNKLEI